MSDINYLIIYLIACSVHGIKPLEKKIDKNILFEIYSLSKKHQIEYLIYSALKDSEKFQKSIIKDEFKIAKEKAIRKNILFEIERKQIFSQLVKNKIWYMPLKGIIMRDLYPKAEMRQVADIDVLIDKTKRYEVSNIMEKFGYTVEKFEDDLHDTYKKEPIYNFEMHVSLFKKSYNESWYRYYANIKHKLKTSSNNKYEYCMTDNGFYIFLVAHTFKHYESGGTGLRSLIDIYIYLTKKEKSLDWNYIKQELKFLKLDSFEQKIHTLVIKLFTKVNNKLILTKEEESMLNYIIDSGAYGNYENYVRYSLINKDGNITSINKSKYLLSRAFPNREWILKHHLIIGKSIILIPFYYVYRIFKTLIFRRKNLKMELETIKHIKE